MDSPTPKLGDSARLMLTDLASGIGSIHTGTVVDVGPTWVRVRVGHLNYPMSYHMLADHAERCDGYDRDARLQAARRGGR